MFISSELQEKFLNDLIENKTIAAIYLKNGIKLTGQIIGASKDAVFLNSPVTQMVYKSCISTVMFA